MTARGVCAALHSVTRCWNVTPEGRRLRVDWAALRDRLAADVFVSKCDRLCGIPCARPDRFRQSIPVVG
jgi:hypothetical protein